MIVFQMKSKSEIMERLVTQPASSSHPSLGASYRSAGNSIEYSSSLVRTGKNYYGSKPTDGRMSTAAEELALQLGLERSGKDPRQAGVFNDLFARNDSHLYIWQWTETGLRVPKGREADIYETDGQGRKYWAREVLIGDNVVGEILVPEGNRRVVVAWDEVFGVPSATEDIAWPHNPYTTHSWFNPNLNKEDVAVGRWGGWLRGVDGGCLAVDADVARSLASSGGGFRPVRGSLPEIEKEIATTNPTNSESISLKNMEEDYGKMPLAEFRKKYNL